MTARAPVPESMSFHRNRRLFGLEVRTVHDSSKTWCCYSSDYEFLAPASWHGEVRHRGKTNVLEPGRILGLRPGDVYAAPIVGIAGSGSSLLIEPGVFAEYLDEHSVRLGKLDVAANSRMSPALARRISDVYRAFHAECSTLEIQSALVEFFALAVPELLGQAPRRRAEATPENRAVALRLRECLAQDLGGDGIDLDALAREANLSRFHTLRLFKRHFGLPPHAYHLCMRLGVAQRSLRSGLKPADVAAQCGFVDQSHLTRHFKRLYRVTPAEYARIGAAGA
jgi:AraC-like DNA-binding protein